MFRMDSWSLALLAAAVYLAVTALTRMMRDRHDALIARLRRQWQEEQDRRAAEERQKRYEERQRRKRERLQQQAEQASDRAA